MPLAVLFPLVCVLILWIPVPWGSNRVWSWALLEVLVFCLLAFWAAVHVVRPLPLSDRDNIRFFLLTGLWLGYHAIYLLPFPNGLVSALAPATAEVYRAVDLLNGDKGIHYYLSVDRHATLVEMLKGGAYLGLCYLVYEVLTSKRRLKVLLWLLLTMGVLQASFGMFASFTGLRLVPDSLTAGHWDLVIGTFVNRNHFSAHLAMAVAAGMALLLPHLSHGHRPAGWRGLLVRQAAWLSTTPGITVLMLVIVFAALFASGSRGALAALFSALCLALLVIRVGRGPDALELRIVPVVLLVLVGAVVWMGATDFMQRILEIGAAPGERLRVWVVTHALIQDNLLLGVGPGNYTAAFAAYRDGALRPLVYDHAHNDYLEMLAEQGIVGSLLLALAIGWLLFIIVRGTLKRRDRVLRGALFGSLVAVLTMLIHGLVDFNFHIPANAGYFYVWAGIGLAARRLPHDS